MLMAFLVLSWVWDRVLTDCRGQTEAVSYYFFQATIREMAFGSCPAGQGNRGESCPVLVPAPPIAFGPNIGDPGKGRTVFTWVDPVTNPELLPDPPLGGLAVWPWPTPDNPDPVVAVDRAGNSCRQVCQGAAVPPRETPGREKPQLR